MRPNVSIVSQFVNLFTSNHLIHLKLVNNKMVASVRAKTRSMGDNRVFGVAALHSSPEQKQVVIS
jgi:hypothetical protein